MVKPDGVQRGLVGDIVARFERRGLRLVAMKMMSVSDELARRHYDVHKEKGFFEGLIRYIMSGPVVAMVWEGTDAIAAARLTMGVTKPAQAAPGSIRGDLALEMGRNLVHGSDGPETAATEIALWFGEGELISYEREMDRWIFE